MFYFVEKWLIRYLSGIFDGGCCAVFNDIVANSDCELRRQTTNQMRTLPVVICLAGHDGREMTHQRMRYTLWENDGTKRSALVLFPDAFR
jgi:hypothetical protein